MSSGISSRAFPNSKLHSLKAQSAMEYLMTYGWAILIIAMVLVALFALGIFNSANFAPKATAGACQVVRNVESVTLQGQCQGEMPEYVAYVSGKPVAIGNVSYGVNSFTASAWVHPTQGSYTNVLEDHNGNGYGWELGARGCGTASEVFFRFDTSAYANQRESPGCPSVGQSWVFLAITVDGHQAALYGNGKYLSGLTINGNVPSPSTLAFGEAMDGGGNYYGYLSDVQIYNASLSANDVEQLYMEGIGGAPIDPLHVVGWWPLNGNAQDYSGNSNNGQAPGVSYTSAWTSGYTQP